MDENRIRKAAIRLLIRLRRIFFREWLLKWSLKLFPTEIGRWEVEISDALAGVLEKAIREGSREAEMALVAVDLLDVRGYTLGLIRRIQEAEALLAQRGVAEVVPNRDDQKE